MNAGPLVVVGDALLDVDVEGSAEPAVPGRAGAGGRRGAGMAARRRRRTGRFAGGTVGCRRRAGRPRSATTRPADAWAGLLAADVDVVSLPLVGTTPSKTRVRAGGHPWCALTTATGGPADGEPGAEVSAYCGRRPRSWSPTTAAVSAAHPGFGVGRPKRPAGCRSCGTRIRAARRPVPGVRLATPNEQEARGFAGDQGDAGALALILRRHWRCDAVAVTLGDRGAVLGVQRPESDRGSRRRTDSGRRGPRHVRCGGPVRRRCHRGAVRGGGRAAGGHLGGGRGGPVHRRGCGGSAVRTYGRQRPRATGHADVVDWAAGIRRRGGTAGGHRRLFRPAARRATCGCWSRPGRSVTRWWCVSIPTSRCVA